MPRRPLTEPERERMRQRILDATEELFDANGVGAVSMRAIGARVGLAASALYAYFPTKLDLIHALWRGAMVEMEGRFRCLSEQEPDPIRAVVLLGRAHAEFALEQPARFRLLFLTSPEKIDAAFVAADHYQSAYQLLRNRIAEAIAQRRLVITDAELAAQTLCSSIYGVLALALTHKTFLTHPTRLLVETVIQTLVRGMVRGGDGG